MRCPKREIYSFAFRGNLDKMVETECDSDVFYVTVRVLPYLQIADHCSTSLNLLRGTVCEPQ